MKELNGAHFILDIKLLSYIWFNDYTKICFKSKIYNKMVSKKRVVTNLLDITTVLYFQKLAHEEIIMCVRTVAYIIFTSYVRART